MVSHRDEFSLVVFFSALCYPFCAFIFSNMLVRPFSSHWFCVLFNVLTVFFAARTRFCVCFDKGLMSVTLFHFALSCRCCVLFLEYVRRLVFSTWVVTGLCVFTGLLYNWMCFLLVAMYFSRLSCSSGSSGFCKGTGLVFKSSGFTICCRAFLGKGLFDT